MSKLGAAAWWVVHGLMIDTVMRPFGDCSGIGTLGGRPYCTRRGAILADLVVVGESGGFGGRVG